MGKTGLRRLAEINVQRAHEAQELLRFGARLEDRFTGPFFNEFVIKVKQVDDLMRRCSEQKIIPGIALARWYPELADCLLVCATEMNDREGISRLGHAVSG
jgi:glycine dehydrogenase subunit 1